MEAPSAQDPAPSWSEERVAALVRAHQAGLRSYLAALGCPVGRVDDIVQDTFLELLARELSPIDDRATGALLRVMARHQFFKAQRRLRLQPVTDTELVDRAWDRFERDDGGEGYLAALRQCLQTLDGRSRRALELRYGEGLARVEIARDLDLEESGVKSLLVRALRWLRGCIERRLR